MSIFASFKIHVSTAHFVASVQGWEVVLEEAAWDWLLRRLSLGIINVFASFKIHVSTAHFRGWRQCGKRQPGTGCSRDGDGPVQGHRRECARVETDGLLPGEAARRSLVLCVFLGRDAGHRRHGEDGSQWVW